MPTFYGKYELPDPVQRHRGLVTLLLRAAGPGESLPRYRRALNALVAQFLSPRTSPSYSEFGEAIDSLLAILRDAALDERGVYVHDPDRSLLSAAEHLQRADVRARDELPDDDGDD